MSDFLNSTSPRTVSRLYKLGYERLEAFRKARFKIARSIAGGYYDHADSARATIMPVMFHALRILAPNLVMNFPKHIVETPYQDHKEYAELLGLALSYDDKRQRITNKYSQFVIDAVITLGILKTGLGPSATSLEMEDDARIDPGQIYTGVVDFDNWVTDPRSKEHLWADASFLGDRIQIPRRVLLESGYYNNDLILKLPSMGDQPDADSKVKSISEQNVRMQEVDSIEDTVEIAELWIPSANTTVTIAADGDLEFGEYLREADYNGVPEGPYTLLSFSPPLPNNPLPVPLAGTWMDIAIALNRVARKEVDQAEAQKTLYAYKPSAVDDAISMKDAMDGQGIKMEDPAAVKVIRVGGQEMSNVQQLNLLMTNFNTFANNPEAIGGYDIGAKSATAANILNQRSNIGLEDMKDKVYISVGEEGRRRAFYMHDDPLINLPMNRRVRNAGSRILGMQGQVLWSMPPHEEEVSTILTPELRRGNFFDFAFTIEPQSMSRLDAQQRLQIESALAQQIIPAVVAAAQGAQAIGLPFNVRALLLRYARDAGIDWMGEVLLDQETAMDSAMKEASGPPADGNTDKTESEHPQPPPQPNPNLQAGVRQNGQPPQVMGNPAPVGGNQNAGAQAGVQDSQRALRSVFTRGLGAGGPLKTAFNGV